MNKRQRKKREKKADGIRRGRPYPPDRLGRKIIKTRHWFGVLNRVEHFRHPITLDTGRKIMLESLRPLEPWEIERVRELRNRVG